MGEVDYKVEITDKDVNILLDTLASSQGYRVVSKGKNFLSKVLIESRVFPSLLLNYCLKQIEIFNIYRDAYDKKFEQLGFHRAWALNKLRDVQASIEITYIFELTEKGFSMYISTESLNPNIDEGTLAYINKQSEELLKKYPLIEIVKELDKGENGDGKEENKQVQTEETIK